MKTPDMRSLIEAVSDVDAQDKTIDEIFLQVSNGGHVEQLSEGKWLKGNRIRIDQPTHGAGQTHAHIYGRKGNEIGVINLDGTASHGKGMRLTKADADALQARGVTIPNDRLVEWVVCSGISPQMLFG